MQFVLIFALCTHACFAIRLSQLSANNFSHDESTVTSSSSLNQKDKAGMEPIGGETMLLESMDIESMLRRANLSSYASKDNNEATWMYYAKDAALCYEFKTFFPLSYDNVRAFSKFGDQCIIEEGYLMFLRQKLDKAYLPSEKHYLGLAPTEGAWGCQMLRYSGKEVYSDEWNEHLLRGQKMSVYGRKSSSEASLISPQGVNHFYMYLWILDKCVKYNPLLHSFLGRKSTDKAKGVWNTCFAGWKDGKNPITKQFTKDLPYGACAWAACKCGSEAKCINEAQYKHIIDRSPLLKIAHAFAGDQTQCPKEGIIG